MPNRKLKTSDSGCAQSVGKDTAARNLKPHPAIYEMPLLVLSENGLRAKNSEAREHLKAIADAKHRTTAFDVFLKRVSQTMFQFERQNFSAAKFIAKRKATRNDKKL